MDLPTFRLTFPEFGTAGDPLVNQFLGFAANACDTTVYGARFDEAHGCLAAHLLCMSPYGKTARLAPAPGVVTTTYEQRYKAVRDEMVTGVIVS